MSHVRLTTMGFVFQQAYVPNYLNIQENVRLPSLKAVPMGKEAALARVAR